MVCASGSDKQLRLKLRYKLTQNNEVLLLNASFAMHARCIYTRKHKKLSAYLRACSSSISALCNMKRRLHVTLTSETKCWLLKAAVSKY